MDRNDPLYPKRWILYWHGSGDKRGTHVMELRGQDLSYNREIAYLGSGVPWPDKAQPDGLHDAAEIMVREHNLVVDRLRAVLKLDEIAVQ